MKYLLLLALCVACGSQEETEKALERLGAQGVMEPVATVIPSTPSTPSTPESCPVVAPKEVIKEVLVEAQAPIVEKVETVEVIVKANKGNMGGGYFNVSITVPKAAFQARSSIVCTEDLNFVQGGYECTVGIENYRCTQYLKRVNGNCAVYKSCSAPNFDETFTDKAVAPTDFGGC